MSLSESVFESIVVYVNVSAVACQCLWSLALPLQVPDSPFICADHVLVRVPDHVGLSVRVCALHRVSVRVQVSGSISVRGVSVALFCL